MSDEMNAFKFAKEIIDGPGGFNTYEDREMVVFPDGDRIAVAEWTLRCLANPKCEGSDIALKAIMEKRGKNGELYT